MRRFLLSLLTLFAFSVIAHAELVNLSFSNINGTSWNNSYSSREYSTDEFTVTLSNASKQTGTITDYPVVKTGNVTIKLKNDKTFKSIKFTLKQWGTKTKTASLKYSTDGTNFQAFNPSVSSSNFVVGTDNIPDNVIAIQMTFSDASNQVGIQSIEYQVNGAVEDNRQDAALEFSETEVSANLGEEFTAPTLTKATTADVVYSSSEEAVATVDATTGAVTLLSRGVTIITAAAEANDDYKAGSASYTLTVVDPNALDVTFDFVNETYGLERGNNSTYHKDGTTITNQKVSITMNVVSGNGFRLWSDGMRVYKGSAKMTFTAPGYNITKVEITSASAMPIAFDGEEKSTSATVRTWTGNQAEVVATLTPGSTIAVTSILVCYAPAGDPSKENVELSFPAEAYTAVYPGSFEAPELTKSADVAVSYTSTDESVATVDAATGAVTLVGPGSTTIKVESEETDTYNSASTFYNLTVELGAQSLAAIYEAGEGVVCVVDFEMTVTYINGRSIYVKAGDEYGLVYDAEAADTKFAVGDVIPAGWKGSYKLFNGVPEVVPSVSLPASTENVGFQPRVVAEVNEAMINEIVVLENVVFAEATQAERNTFTGTVGETEYTFYNSFSLASVDAGKYNVKAVVSIHNTDLQLIPIEYNVVLPEIEMNFTRVEGENKVIVSLSLPEGSHPDMQIWYKIEEAGAPAAAPARAAAETDADGYTLYTAPFEITKASTVSYYSELNGAKSTPQVVEFNSNLTTGVENIAVDAEGEVRYYDLSGRRVYNPAAGIYIRIAGGKATKTIF